MSIQLFPGRPPMPEVREFERVELAKKRTLKPVTYTVPDNYPTPQDAYVVNGDVLFLLTCSGDSCIPTPRSGVWTSHPKPRYSCVKNGKIYMFGDILEDYPHSCLAYKDVYVYDTEGNSTKVGELVQERAPYGVAPIYGEPKVAVIGGRTYTTAGDCSTGEDVKTTEIYNVETNTSTQVDDFPGDRTWGYSWYSKEIGKVVVVDDKTYDIYLLDPSSGTWDTLGNLDDAIPKDISDTDYVIENISMITYEGKDAIVAFTDHNVGGYHVPYNHMFDVKDLSYIGTLNLYVDVSPVDIRPASAMDESTGDRVLLISIPSDYALGDAFANKAVILVYNSNGYIYDVSEGDELLVINPSGGIVSAFGDGAVHGYSSSTVSSISENRFLTSSSSYKLWSYRLP